MKTKSKYRNLVNDLGIFLYDITDTDIEKYLLSKLQELVKLDRVNKVAIDRFRNDPVVKKMLRKIDSQISKYRRQLLDIEMGNCTFIVEDSEILNKKIAELLELKSNIENFILPTATFAPEYIERLKDICAKSLKEKEFSSKTYFGGKLVSKSGDINDELAEAVYNVLFDENLMNELNEAVKIEERIKKISSVLDVYNEALSVKDLIYDNQEDIFLYNSIRAEIKELNDFIEKEKDEHYDVKINSNNLKIRELNSNSFKGFIHKSAISKLKTLDILYEYNKDFVNQSLVREKELINALDAVKKRLSANGLGSILLQIEAKDSVFSKEENVSLSLISKLPTFNSKEDIETYYEELAKDVKKNSKKLEEALDKKDAFEVNSSDPAFIMITDYYDTSKNIVELGKSSKQNGVLPALALFVINTINSMRDTDVKDIDVTEEDVRIVDELFEDSFDKVMENFESEYIDIVYRKYLYTK